MQYRQNTSIQNAFCLTLLDTSPKKVEQDRNVLQEIRNGVHVCIYIYILHIVSKIKQHVAKSCMGCVKVIDSNPILGGREQSCNALVPSMSEPLGDHTAQDRPHALL